MAAIIISAALAAGYYLWRVPIDITPYRGAIISRIEDVTGAKLTTGQARLRIFPSPYLEVHDVLLTASGEEVLSASLMRLHISILPFFLRKIVIERMSMDNWKANILRRPDGSMAIRDIYERVVQRKHIVTVKSMRLSEGLLTLEDRMGGRRFGVKARLERGRVIRRNGALRFQASLGLDDGTQVFARGEVEKSEEGVSLKGNATVADMNLARLRTYVKRPLVSGRASADLSFTYAEGLKARGRLNYRDVTLNEPSLSARPLRSDTGSAGFALSLRGKDLDLEIKKAEIDMGRYVVSGSATLAGNLERPDDLSLEMNLASTPIPVKDVKFLVMDRVFRDKKTAWINEITPLGGAVSVKSFTLKTRVGSIHEKGSFTRPGVMRLEAGLEGLRFRHKILGGEEVSNLFGRLLVTGGTIDFEDLSGNVGTGVIEKLSYRMENVGRSRKHATYDLSLLGHIDAGRGIRLTIRLFRDTGEAVKRQLRRISATGDTRVKFLLKGTIGVKHSSKFSVNLGLRKATFRYEGFPLSFTSVDGNIDIDNRRFTFTDLVMRDGADSSMVVNGYVRDYTRPAPYFSLNARGSLYGGTLSAFTSGASLEGLSTVEAGTFTSRVSGPMKALKVKAAVDLGPAGIEYRGLIDKKPGVPLSISTEMVVGRRAVEIKNTLLKTVGTSMAIKGTVERNKKGNGPYNFFIESRKARLYDLADITPIVAKQADTAGTLNIILKVSRAADGAAPSYKGVISLEKGHFSTPLAAEPVKALELFLEFDGDRAKLRIPAARIGSSDLQGSIEILSIARKKIGLNLIAKRLDTSDIWGEKAAGLLEWREKIRALGFRESGKKKAVTGTGKISVKSGALLGEEVKDFKSEILMSPQFVRIDPLVLVTKGGTISGKAVFFRKETSPRIFEASAGISGIRIKRLVSRLGAKKDILTGDLNGSFNLSCERGVKPFMKCLSGSTHLNAEHGRMWKFQVISKIFSIVNIISIDELFKKGLPYRYITADFDIKKGIISTDNLLFDSDSMRMSAVLTIDSVAATIDATLGVHPFVTIDKIVTNIPLVGWIIGGKEKSSVSLYYTIKGPLKTPVVEPAPIKNIQKGILGKIERLITSPIKIIQMGSDIIGNKENGGKDGK